MTRKAGSDIRREPFLRHRASLLSNETSMSSIATHQPIFDRGSGKMFSLRGLPAGRVRKPIYAQCMRLNRTSARPLSILSANASRPFTHQNPAVRSHISPSLVSSRTYSTKSTADALIEEIQDQYATARDEFEIASEETEKKSVYAADDRTAAREELNKLKEMFQRAVTGSEGEEVQRRVGQRIRELDNAVEGLEKAALEE
jgi:hypothetical protein